MSDPARVELIEVVWVSFDRVGPGDEPARSVNQYWSKDGRLLAEFDHAFHAADVPAYEVVGLRAQVGQLLGRLRAYEPDAAPAPILQAPEATNSEVRQQAQEVA